MVTSGGGGEAPVFLTILDFAVTEFALLATAGIVSADFALGHYRTLFARPVSPPLYYLQRWLTGGVAGAGRHIGGRASLPRPASAQHLPIGRVLAQSALFYLLLGGLIFLLSTVTRRDWLIAVLAVAAHGGLGLARDPGRSRDRYRGPLLYAVLPPFRLVDVSEPVPAGGDLLHVLLYGLVLVGGALLVIRLRPLARGARE